MLLVQVSSFAPPMLNITAIARLKTWFVEFGRRVTLVACSSSLTVLINQPQLVAQQPDCQNPLHQVEINRCADLKAKAADRRLNQVYKQVRAKYQGTRQETLLINAELAWIKFRDASCAFSKSRFEGGSIAPLVYSSCNQLPSAEFGRTTAWACI